LERRALKVIVDSLRADAAAQQPAHRADESVTPLTPTNASTRLYEVGFTKEGVEGHVARGLTPGVARLARERVHTVGGVGSGIDRVRRWW
jgi:hypothetical protein